MMHRPPIFSFFFFNDTATTEIYTLSLHDALPILQSEIYAIHIFAAQCRIHNGRRERMRHRISNHPIDRKSTRLNSSHGYISYAVFCLKKKKQSTRESKQSLDK